MNQMKKWTTDTSNWSAICNVGMLFLQGNNPTDWDLPSNIIDQLFSNKCPSTKRSSTFAECFDLKLGNSRNQKEFDVQTGNKFIIQTNIPNLCINPNPQFPETFKAEGKCQWN